MHHLFKINSIRKLLSAIRNTNVTFYNYYLLLLLKCSKQSNFQTITLTIIELVTIQAVKNSKIDITLSENYIYSHKKLVR